MMFAQSDETTVKFPAGHQAQRHPESSSLPSASSLLISLATAPVLLGIVGGRALSEFVQQLGLASEELFRAIACPFSAFQT
ncbi:MAG: hypothetical protein HC839_01485 [Leptolyngbyaceae cyanobacterium RM2_2_21]|nr:hypothetical protein [Leptolyngbyaceae cyanobacterium RM2_2_21]